MCAISSFVRRSTVLQRWHLHPIYMFFVHMIHNYFMTHRIDWVDPEYYIHHISWILILKSSRR